MGISFSVGVVVTGVVAFRLLMLIVGMAMVGLLSTSANDIYNELYAGDSQTRLAVLTQLKTSFDTQPPVPVDPNLSAWILPARKQSQSDPDPNVVSLATEIVAIIDDNTVKPPQ